MAKYCLEFIQLDVNPPLSSCATRFCHVCTPPVAGVRFRMTLLAHLSRLKEIHVHRVP